jgi:hypothetical protein
MWGYKRTFDKNRGKEQEEKPTVWHWCLMPIIVATQEAEIRMITI